jgi:tetratricopeptide (TPR) repeat protein
VKKSVLERALGLVRQGDGVGAEALVAEAAERVKRESGDQSPVYAAALFDHGHVLCGTGDLPQAADVLTEACSIRVEGDEATRDRLTYSMNLGEILLRLGRFDEAEKVLRDGLVEREAFYGAEHPGTAFGLEPLAEVLRAKDDLDGAAALIERAVGAFASEGHSHMIDALALQACIAVARDERAFESMASLAEDAFEAVIQAVLERADLEPPKTYLLVLDQLEDALVERRGEDDPWMIPLMSAVAEAARQTGGQAERVNALEWLVDALADRGDPAACLAALQGLALAHDESGQAELAEQTYKESIELARRHAPRKELAAVQRNFGLFLVGHDRAEEAGQQLQLALDDALASNDKETIGRMRVALGVVFQHGGDLESARGHLTEAVELLAPDHPDGLVARSHLQALEQGAECGCDDMGDAMGQAIAHAIQGQLPPGLLAGVHVEMDGDEGPAVRVALAREPSQEEMVLLERAIREATASLREKVEQRR